MGFLDKDLTFKQVARRFIISFLVLLCVVIIVNLVHAHNRNSKFETYFGTAYPTSRNAANNVLSTILDQTKKMKDVVENKRNLQADSCKKYADAIKPGGVPLGKRFKIRQDCDDAKSTTKLALKNLDEACSVGGEALNQFGIRQDPFANSLKDVYQCNQFFNH
jgi:hypothetical protein